MGTCPSAHSVFKRDKPGGGGGSQGVPAYGKGRVVTGGAMRRKGLTAEGWNQGGEEDLEDQAARRALVSGVQRWYLDVSEWGELSTDQWEGLLGLLPEADSTRVKAFLRENDRMLALGSRLLQRAVVSKVFGLRFSDVDISRTSENKPFFTGVKRAVEDGSVSPLLKNWNFNVSHHGKYVAIASEPACLCGLDIVDTNGRADDKGPAEDYLRYFTDHFTDEEWETIKRPADHRDKLRRFYLHWGLKEAYVKAIGQGLRYDLRRISFVAGDWVDCCNTQHQRPHRRGRSSSPSFSGTEENYGKSDVNDPSQTSQGCQQRHQCSCPRSLAAVAAAARLQANSDSETGSIGDGGADATGRGSSWGQEDRLGCKCGIGLVTVEVDRVPRPDWSFKVFPFPDGYAACVAKGPPSACCRSGQEVGVISDPDASERGQSLPQLRFRRVRLEEIVPGGVAARLFGGGL
eukprot:g9809.t1